MNSELLKKLGNIQQIAGVTESRLTTGRGEGVQIAEFYNAAGLRFTVMPDRCMDLYGLSFKGVNLCFQTKNGITAPHAFNALGGEFAQQWPGGLLSTCGLDNVGGGCSDGTNYPVHGRISYMPAQHYGVETVWEGDEYYLRAQGETHMTKLYGRHLSIKRSVETTLNGKAIKIHDKITNFEAEDEPYMLLYHINFGYPLLSAESLVYNNAGSIKPMNDMSTDFHHMMDPVDGRGEELYFMSDLQDKACAMIYNPTLEMAAYVAWDTKNLPNMLEWKNMKSHDYVLALEPCNTCGLHRLAAAEQGKLAVIPAYSFVENDVVIGVLDGKAEIEAFIKANNLKGNE